MAKISVLCIFFLFTCSLVCPSLGHSNRGYYGGYRDRGYGGGRGGYYGDREESYGGGYGSEGSDGGRGGYYGDREEYYGGGYGSEGSDGGRGGYREEDKEQYGGGYSGESSDEGYYGEGEYYGDGYGSAGSDEGYGRRSRYGGGYESEGGFYSEDDESYRDLFSGLSEYSSDDIFSSGLNYFLRFNKELFVERYYKFKFLYQSDYKSEFQAFFRYFMENSEDYRGVKAFRHCMRQYGFYGVFGDKINSCFRKYSRYSGSFSNEFDDDTTFEAMVKFASDLEVEDFAGYDVQSRFYRYCLRWGIDIDFESSRKLFEGRNRYMTYQFFKFTHRSSSDLKYGFAFKDCMNEYGTSGYLSGEAFQYVKERLGGDTGESCDDMDCFRENYGDVHGKVQGYFKRYCRSRGRSSGFLGKFSKFFEGFFDIFNLSFNHVFAAYFDYAGRYIKDCDDVEVCRKCFHKHAKNPRFFREATRCFDRSRGRSG